MSSPSHNVFLAPVDVADPAATLESPVTAEEQPDSLESEDAVRVWAAPPGDQSQTSFEKMESGDLVIFYEGGSFVGTGWVGETLEDDGTTGASLWDDDSLTMLFTVDGFESVEVDGAAVNRIFDYSESWSPGGLLRVADSRVENDPAAIELAIQQYDEQA